MKKIILFGIFLMLMSLNGCKAQRETIYVDSSQLEMEEKAIHFYIKEETQMSLYEPAKGVYLGAYSQEESLEEFEELVGQKQGFEVFQYTKKGSVTHQDLLRCVANQHTPYIKFLLEEEDDLARVYTMIGDLNNRYQVPLFIELYPVTSQMEDPISYKEQYEKAYKLIKKYLDQSVVVWSIDIEKAYEMPLYYPGSYRVDWVGVNCYWPKYRNEVAYEIDPIEKFDYVYKNIQQEKPILLSGVAVSHFSEVDHTYTIADAKNKLRLFYEEIPDRYPRLKGILYIDVNMKAVTKEGQDDYRVSTQQELRSYLKDQFEKSLFLKTVYPQEQEKLDQYQLYDLAVKVWEDTFYVEKEEIEALFLEKQMQNLTLIKEGENQYYRLEEVMEKVPSYYLEAK